MSKTTDVTDVPIFDDGDDEPVRQESVSKPEKASMEWYDLVTRPSFLKAVALATLVIVAIFLSPVSEYVKGRVSALENVPHATVGLNAVVAAFAITFLRPPLDEA